MYFDGSFPSFFFRDVDYTHVKPAASQTYVDSFLCAVEGGMQSAFQSRLVSLFLFNCPFQLSGLKMGPEKEIIAEFKGNNRTQYSYSCISHTSS